MLKVTSENFRAYLILQLTKEIIRSTKSYQKAIIKNEIKKTLEQKNESLESFEQKNEVPYIIPNINIPLMVHEKIKKEKERAIELKKEEKEFRLEQEPTRRIIPSAALQRSLRRLRIPELRLPETVSYLRPIPTSQYIDLDKLNPLINDPGVKTIECDGSNEKIVVTGLMGRKNTGIILNKEEIENIIARFSEATRIPIFEGLFKVVFGRLVLSAIVSDIVDSKFIIRKMSNMPASMSLWR